MVTKEQALTCTNFKQIAYFDFELVYGSFGYQQVTKATVLPLDKPINWRVNGKCKTWKTRPEEFKLPIKHGLYSYGYLTHENAHLFEVIS
jgi:hypothetical protein